MAIGANITARSGAFPDAYTFLGETAGFMYGLVAVLDCVAVISLRYTDPELQRPHRIGKRGNWVLWILALLTTLVWGYVAFGCVHWTNQLAAGLILLTGIPVYGYYRWWKS